MTEEQMRVLRMIEEGKISAADGAQLLGALTPPPRPGAPAAPPRPSAPTAPLPPVPPIPPLPPLPPEGRERDREQARRDREQGRRDREQARREVDQVRREAEQVRREAEQERRRIERERGRRSGIWDTDDIFWGGRGRRDPRDTGPLPESGPPGPGRWFRVRVTDVQSGKVKVNVSLPMALINFGLKLGAKYIPEGAGFDVEEIRQAVRSGMVGKIIEAEDSEDGERVEVFVE